jgi:hypothetical protein
MYFLISTYSNFLTISLNENGKLLEKSIPLDATVLNDSQIRNITEFTKILFNALYDMKGGGYKNIPVVFLTDPVSNHFRFIKSQKELNFDNQTSQIFTELNLEPENYYFGVHKISPFVSQFIASKKTDIDVLINIANELECELLGIFSYIPLLAKYVNHNGNLILISSYLGNIVVALSEMNGVYFNNKYGSFKDAPSVKEMVDNLRIFKSSTQTNKIVSFNFENPEASSKLGISEITISNDLGFKNPIHNLADQVLNEDYINSSYNLVNCYFQRSKEKKKPSLIVVGTFVLFLMAGVGGWAYNTYVDNNFYNLVVQNVLGDSSSDHDQIVTQPAVALNRLPEAPSNTSFPGTEVSENKLTEPGSTLISEFSTPPSTVGEYKRGEVKTSIINSTGITGLAKRNSQVLEVLGYKNIKLETSNEVISGNLVKIKPSISKYKDQIQKDFVTFKDLKIEDSLPESSPLDMVVVLGK